MNKVQIVTICEVKKGQSITKKKIVEGNIPVVAGGRQPAYYHNASNRTRNTITVSASGAYAGFVNYFEEPIFASDCSTIKSLDENKVLTKYVFFILRSQQKQIYNLQRGAGQPHVYPKDLSKIEIIVPKLETQRQIVSILEKAESLKQKREETNKETQKIIQSIFYDMFGDPVKNEKGFEVKTLKEVANKITDGTHKTPKYVDKGVPFWRVTDLTNSNDSKKFISKEEHEELIKRCKPEKGDILYSKNGTIGIAKTVNWDWNFSIFVSLCLIKPNADLIRSKYLEIFLNTPFALYQATKKSKQGTITNLHLIEIKQIKIPLPSLDKQDEFLERVQLLESIQSKQQSSTKEINNLFNALMQKAFNGELY